ncbi:MAG: cellulase family glycosylhydrolase, partial [Lachnospiraceae bacterium]|nr:cellulase family glycosylhydrolase [Lachnospiraceae bacterium]
MKRLMILTALLTAVLSLTAFGAENAGAVPSVNGALHVEGTGLFDSAGQRVQLRGVSTHGVQWYPQYVNEGTFRELRDKWNMNAVRLAMYTAEGGWCEADNVKRSGFRELLAQGIEAARAADVYAILDWHILSDGDPNTHLEEAKAFFAYYSERYRDADHILYEICNEPNG